jgi:Ran GTPase-activating protein (RanGAP) involved in mRNA processing and transport
MPLLAKALSSHPTLRKLDLSRNVISFPGVCHIAEGLRTNTSLSRLSLAHNLLRGDGVARIANVAIAHPALVTLDLRGTPLRRLDRRRLEARTRYANPNL